MSQAHFREIHTFLKTIEEEEEKIMDSILQDPASSDEDYHRAQVRQQEEVHRFVFGRISFSAVPVLDNFRNIRILDALIEESQERLMLIEKSLE